MAEKDAAAAEAKEKYDALVAETEAAAAIEDNLEKAFAYRNRVFAKMEALREVADSMEAQTAAAYWPYPSYTDLLFGV